MNPLSEDINSVYSENADDGGGGMEDMAPTPAFKGHMVCKTTHNRHTHTNTHRLIVSVKIAFFIMRFGEN